MLNADVFNCLYSAAEYSDQLSMKDSGKGDSDFNDSDSDISGDGCRKAIHLNAQATCKFI